MGMYSIGTPCPLCGEPLNKEDDLIGFGCLAMSDPTFAPLDDYVVHRTCLDVWERRDDFIAYHNRLVRPPGRTLGDDLVMYDGHVRYQREADALELGRHIASVGHDLSAEEIADLLKETSTSPWEVATAAMSKGLIEDELYDELMYPLGFEKHLTREEFEETQRRLEEQRRDKSS
jgi:hypothetical protein